MPITAMARFGRALKVKRSTAYTTIQNFLQVATFNKKNFLKNFQVASNKQKFLQDKTKDNKTTSNLKLVFVVFALHYYTKIK